MTHSTLNINAPDDMYTMSNKRVQHIIQPDEWVILKKGSGNEFQEWAIGCLFGSFGFFQNVYAIGCWVYDHKQALTTWDVLASFVCIGLLVGGVVLAFVSWNKKSEFQKIVGEIDCREPHPFGGEDRAAQG